MGTKTISIRDDTCYLQKNEKREGERFGDIIHCLLVKEKGNLSVYFGALKDEEVLEGLEEDFRKNKRTSDFLI